jgi:hypothetical protein
MAGLLYLGVTFESARTVLNFHFNNIVTLFAIILGSLFLLVGLERQTIGVLAIGFMVISFILFDRKFKKLHLDYSSTKTVKNINKSFAISFVFASHLLVIILTGALAYLVFGK